MKVVIVGAGYVGLTTGVCLSDLGHDVVCVDKDPHRLHLLMKGKSPIFEPGLEELMDKNINSGRLTFADKLEDVVKGSQVIFICVNTPPKGASARRRGPSPAGQCVRHCRPSGCHH